MNILFVCKHNRFRSKVAEAIFNNNNLNLDNQAKSAGLRRDMVRRYVSINVHNVMEKKGIKIEDKVAREIDEHLIKWADKIIIVADNVNPEIFPKEKTEVWPIKDTDESNLKEIREIINKIEDKVKKLKEEIEA